MLRMVPAGIPIIPMAVQVGIAGLQVWMVPMVVPMVLVLPMAAQVGIAGLQVTDGSYGGSYASYGWPSRRSRPPSYGWFLW